MTLLLPEDASFFGEIGPTMGVALGPHWRRFIARMISTGRYDSAGEIVRDAFRALEEREASQIKPRDIGEASMTLCGRCGLIRKVRTAITLHDLYRCGCPDRNINP